ncbi:WD repeat protein [Polychaeton citri CBS 116435]|uniref:WD repeat protein n=1 Tax=Polychaeton citri CBS 116435 TaxID=1314669 RepID=A0A9P4UUX5_9PEZI|nr:WD repeat protein [Polychaeton citri CBS 116435]
MKLSNPSSVPVYTISGESTGRPLPEWLARKRKRSLKQDPEYANRIELLQDFEFEEASQCVRISEDANWVMSTGTYKPQIHTHYLPHLSLSYARHTNTVNETFILLSSDYSKSLHLQTDRFLEFHTPGGLHYTTRIPRYGRDLKYNKRTAEALVPSVGVNADGNGEVFRLNLELGRFMRGYEVEVGGDDLESLGGGALQGGIRTGAVNCAAVAEESHGLMGFGTSLGTVEFWDNRSRNRVSTLGPPTSLLDSLDGADSAYPEITALDFHRSGLQFVTGASNGIVHTYDLRSPVPLRRKDQGYGFPIKSLRYLTPSTRSASATAGEKLLTADKRVIKLWDSVDGHPVDDVPWTSVEPTVDLNHVEWVPDSGMLLTANEGRQQHSFFIPQLGQAPKWCAFLDNLVEEMAEDSGDPNAFNNSIKAGEVYDNYKFLSHQQLRELNLDHLVGTTNLLRPYMHGFFVAQKLYEQARLISNPEVFEQQRQKSIQEKIDKERESRIRGNKKVAVKVNRRLAEKLAAREEANERRKAARVLRQGGDVPRPDVLEQQTGEAAAAIDDEMEVDGIEAEANATKPSRNGLMEDDRFQRLFQDEDFEIDETSREFAMLNPSTVPTSNLDREKRGLTAVEAEELDDRRGSDDDTEDSEAEAIARQYNSRQREPSQEAIDNKRIGSTSYKRSGHKPQEKNRAGPTMTVSRANSKSNKFAKGQQSRSFGDLAASMPAGRGKGAGHRREGGIVGEKEISFAPAKKGKMASGLDAESTGRQPGRGAVEKRDRRSASGNVFRRM